ncbi:MAG TPA: hypothetical protein VKI17_05365 [Gemmataceae bacterium]|nr:hypothetical protein [Gemmataceae bacterium]
MRYLVFGLGVLFLSGCSDSKWNFLRKENHTGDARLPLENPTTADLVAYMNRNSQQISSVQCNLMSLDCRYGIQEFSIPSMMVCQKPARPGAGPNFRLVAKAVGSEEADIGSNEQEFWYWLKRNNPPYLVHCSYQDMARGVKIPFPFQPEWVIEALGMGDYGSPESYKPLVARRATYELVKETTVQGQPVQKVTVFNKQPSQAQIAGHILRDARGNVICSARIVETANVSGVLLPRKIVFSYPAEKIELKLKLFDDPRDVLLNQQYEAEQAQKLFTRPLLTGVQSYDLARGLDGATSQVRPAGGFGSQP